MSLSKRIGLSVIGLMLGVGTALGVNAIAAPASNGKLTLESRNTMVLRLPVTDSTMGALTKKLLELDSKLPKGEPIYLYLDTPGGSIFAGQDFIVSALGTGRKVNTVTHFAASMGYILVQHLGDRNVLPNGQLMSHRATISLGGQIPGEFNTRTEFIMNIIDGIESTTASRVNMKVNDYKQLIQNEYWVTGQHAVDAKQADNVVLVNCGPDLRGSYFENLETFFGPVRVEWSQCPLITAPLSVDFTELTSTIDNKEELMKVVMSIKTILNNKVAFVTDSSLREVYNKYVK